MPDDFVIDNLPKQHSGSEKGSAANVRRP